VADHIQEAYQSWPPDLVPDIRPTFALSEAVGLWKVVSRKCCSAADGSTDRQFPPKPVKLHRKRPAKSLKLMNGPKRIELTFEKSESTNPEP
jgi:hypothetical protein